GIELLDKNGHLSAAALTQLTESIGLSVEALKTFSKDLDTQRTLAETRAKLQGVDVSDPLTQLGIDRDLLAKMNVGGALAGLFDGLDTTTAQGQEELRQRYLALIDQIEQGLIPPEAFGQFGDADAFLAFLGHGADALSQLADASRQAAGQMLNVPTVFKLGAARLAAEIPGLGPNGFAPGQGPNMDPGAIGRGLTGEGSLADVLDRFRQGQTKTPDDLLAKLDELKAAMLGTSGTSGGSAAGFRRFADLMGGARPGAPVPGANPRRTDTAAGRPIVQQHIARLELHVDAGQRDARALAREIYAELRQMALAQSGDTLNVGGLV
ncbi:MAG TPA: hypothetical protein VFS40_16020, partial [Gemmatimonadales bacterium]|nr:hypothetical protein [Gemmatimonadales bacterium]